DSKRCASNRPRNQQHYFTRCVGRKGEAVLFTSDHSAVPDEKASKSWRSFSRKSLSFQRVRDSSLSFTTFYNRLLRLDTLPSQVFIFVIRRMSLDGVPI